MASGKDSCGQIGLRITGLENRRGQPGHVNRRELHMILNDGASLRTYSWGFDLNFGHFGAALQRAEMLFHEFTRMPGIEVADNREARVIRRVVQFEKIAD